MEGYEIRAGSTAPAGNAGEVHTLLDGLAWQNHAGNVLGMYMQGLFENSAALRALFGAHVRTLDASLDAHAAEAERAFGAEALRRIASSLIGTLRWAASIRKGSPDVFRAMRANAMKKDFSWNKTASEYERMYSDAHR